MTRLDEYRASPREKMRETSLLSLVRSGEYALDIGARDGYYSRLLRDRYSRVISLDLDPAALPECTNVAADVRRLPFPDRTFDLVFCAEVLEHVPDVQLAAREIERATKQICVIGVPYKQDTRIGRVTCRHCGRIAPSWGHINAFDENKLQQLFSGLRMARLELVGGPVREQTTALATALMDYAGNPWGTYTQQEPCVCGKAYEPPRQGGSITQRAASRAAGILNVLSSRLSQPHAIWLHAVFTR